MSIHMRCLRLNLIKACHIRSVPYSTLTEAQNNITLSRDGLDANRLTSSQEFREFVLSNTYSALNNLVLRKDCSDAKTCNVEQHKRKHSVESVNPIDHALYSRDFDFLLSLGRRIHPERQGQSDIHRLLCNRQSNNENGDCISSSQYYSFKSWIEPITLYERAVLYSDTRDAFKSEGKKQEADKEKKRTGPDQEQLDMIKDYYVYQTPKIVKQGENFNLGLHHVDMIFENNFFEKPKTVQGIKRYAWEFFKIRAYATFIYTHFAFQPRSVTTDLAERCVKLHWRVYYQNQFKLFMFWKFNPFKPAEEKFDWVEGISTFYVNKDGQIIKHRVDRTTPLPVKEKKKKLVNVAGALGLAPTAKFFDLFTKKDTPVKELPTI